jgi:Ca2+:H+ antiporter
MIRLIQEIRRNPLRWLLVLVPVVFTAAKLKPDAHPLLFVLSVLAMVPLPALLSHATESVAARTGDAFGSIPPRETSLLALLLAIQAGNSARRGFRP